MNTPSMKNEKTKAYKIMEQADMRPSYFTTALLFAVLCVASCTQEEVLGTQNEKTSFNIVGDPVRAHLSIAVGNLYFGVETRAEEPVPDYDGEDSEEERHVDDLWLFEYSSASGELIYPPQQVNINRQEELADMEVTLSNNYGKPVTIYVVANSGSGVAENSANWVVPETFGGDITYPGFMTIEELEATTIPTPHPQRMTWDEATGTYVLDSQDAGSVSIPMSGRVEATVKNGADILVPVSRMFAKLLVRVDLSDFNKEKYSSVWLSTITVGNIPEYCTVGALGSSATVVPADYSACPRWLRRSFNAVDESGSGGSGGSSGDGDDEEPYPYLIYVPENIQGENREDGSGSKADNVPNSYALSVTAGIYVETISGATLGEYSSFVTYPGGNSTDNFNVRRNCLYRVTLKINNLTDDVLPSANCIVCLSGETTAFFPYCREETGGGYDFEDYLYSGDDGAKAGQKIDHVGIIWQSKNNQGSSGTGYIGDNSGGDLVWIDEVGTDVVDEYHRRIHVKIPSGKTGNALVGAYNSNGELVWSWHIWSRAKENDPTTVNTKLYYTYDWDENGIYGKDSGRPRVAGYTIMNCNLGSMQDVPKSITEESEVVKTYGTMYQWGRKDPLPPFKSFMKEGGKLFPFSDYMESYYDNEDNEVAFANYGRTSANELFYCLPGEDRPTSFDEAIRHSIQNPTVFVCGMNEARSYDNYDVGWPSNSTAAQIQTTLQNNYPAPHDGNWLCDEENEHYNRLWGGLDPEHDSVGKSYLTGLVDKSDHEIHLFDDYGEKSIFDPCPYGWRVSPPDLWLGFTSTGLNALSYNEMNYNASQSNDYGMTLYLTGWREGESSYFPTSGTRQPNGDCINARICGNYHNATADFNSRVNILHVDITKGTKGEFYLNIFENKMMTYYIKSTGSTVRCIRMDSVQK